MIERRKRENMLYQVEKRYVVDFIQLLRLVIAEIITATTEAL